MIAAVTFEGAIGGKLRTFTKGDTITKSQAEEMNLADKPELTQKGPQDGSKTQKP